MGGIDLSGLNLGANITDITSVAGQLFSEFWLFLALGLGIALAPRFFSIARAALAARRGRA